MVSKKKKKQLLKIEDEKLALRKLRLGGGLGSSHGSSSDIFFFVYLIRDGWEDGRALSIEPNSLGDGDKEL